MMAATIEQIGRSHHVGRKGLDRLGEALADQRLGREMEDHLGAALAHRLRKPAQVADVGDVGVDLAGKPEGLEEARVGGRLQCIAGDAGTKPREPRRQPPAHEAGVAGDEDAAASPERSRHAAGGHACHTCQGARPLAHISFSSCISR
jgi:hypothetical protein